MEGWWNYEFCFNKHVIQFHMEREKIENQINLGIYDAKKSILEPNEEEKFIFQKYNKGTPCDIEDLVRETEVRFYCSNSNSLRNYIRSVEEPSTCRYIVHIELVDLCFHPQLSNKAQTNHIYCIEK